MNDSIYNHPELCCVGCDDKKYCSEQGNCIDDGMDLVTPLFEPYVEPQPIATQEHILYRVFDLNFRLLYAGITLNMYQRFNGHKHTADWWTHAKHITIERFESRAELMAAERRVIVTERPKYNKQHNGGSQ